MKSLPLSGPVFFPPQRLNVPGRRSPSQRLPRLCTLLGTGTFLLLFSRVAAGHDLWIVPGNFFPEAGKRVRVFINNGDAFPGSDTLLGVHRVEQFALHRSGATETFSDFRVDGKSLTLEVRAPERGTAVLTLSTTPRRVRLNAEEFNEYLKESGLTGVLTLRREKDELGSGVVERYTKYAKTILEVGEVGECDEGTWAEPAGLPLEIVPERNPLGLRTGDTLPVVVLFRGQPIQGLEVWAGKAGGERNEVSGTTSTEGRVALPIPGSGRWFLETIHMLRSADEDLEANWESFWTTFTFEVRP